MSCLLIDEAGLAAYVLRSAQGVEVAEEPSEAPGVPGEDEQLARHINIVASIMDLGTLYIFIFVNASAIALQYRLPTVPRVFRAIVNIGHFPLTPLLDPVSSFALVSYLSIDAIVIG